MLSLALAFVFFGPITVPGGAPAIASQSIHVDVVGLRSVRGHVLCFLYNSEAGFPKDQGRSMAKVSGVITGGSSSCDFSNIPNGMYAVSVYHDENDNGHLDANVLGIPKEGVGASNDAKGHFGPPNFKDATFVVERTPLVLTIHIHYL